MTSAPHDEFAHRALFYRGDAEYLAGTVPFLMAGMAIGEPVAVSVPSANLALLRRALAGDADRVRMLDMTEAGRNPGRIIPGVMLAFADEHPGRRVRIIGEPVWAARSEVEYPACAQHEALINHAFAGRPATILCPYDAAGLTATALADAERTHPVLEDAVGARGSRRYAPDSVIAAYNRALPPPSGAVALTVAADVGLPRLRSVVRDTGRRAGLSMDRADDAALVLTELACNGVVHGGGTAQVLVGIDGGRLHCQVFDSGHLDDPLAGLRPAPMDQVSGRGLLLVNHMADLVRTHTGSAGTTIQTWFA